MGRPRLVPHVKIMHYILMVILSVLLVCFATDSWSSFLFFYDQECARTSSRPPSSVSKPPPPDDVGLDPGCRREGNSPSCSCDSSCSWRIWDWGRLRGGLLRFPPAPRGYVHFLKLIESLICFPPPGLGLKAPLQRPPPPDDVGLDPGCRTALRPSNYVCACSQNGS